MAAPISASPASARYSNGAPYSAGWPASSHSGLISPPESRRTSDEKAPPHQLQTNTHRQSLPSIQEALSSTSAKPVPYASPVSASAPPSHPQIPYSQTQVLPPPRTYEQGTFQSSQSRQPSPPVPIQPPPFPRTDLDSRSFAEPRRQSLLHPTISQPPPANSYPAPRYEAPRYEQEPRVAERFVERSMNEYGQPAPLHNQHPYGNAPTQSVQPPHPPPQAQGYPQPPYPPRDDRDLGGPGTLYCRNGHGISTQLAKKQPRSHIAIPERSTRSPGPLKEMLIHGNRVVSCLHRMLDTAVQQQHAADEQSRGARLAPDYDDESIYGDDRHHQNFGGPR
ncbi:hypothetical protein SS1G_10366 [Sclerotinia sclerotiorum 1980 UF-70]|uniref:Uncharacterized protein n=1 Tax=Sclerotinia sclerotiorum (strain ATCC 18683 / 1980 / Ss-1) TaxID=665079 RepID=A7EYF0_SCLS1|nr:hypothetical protein SS1G_10366 [Sclerotinia sclerotiorum 1980 UF-70]EDN94492.1 hypothetical protein SS1G_10366 [Sclerotinia sclerotiorum 1980 UF-70]